MRTLFPKLCAALIVFTLIAACEFNAGSKNAPIARTSITFLHYLTDSLSGGLTEMAKVFNSQNKRYDLKPIPLDHESFKISIKNSLESGNPPDLYSYWGGARTASIIQYLEPIDDIWERNKLDQRFSPALIKAACEYNGKKYFIPLTQHYIGFFYNKKVFDIRGLKPPRTWSEFLAVCARLKSDGITPIALGSREKWPAQFWFDLMLLRTAPYEFRQKLMNGEASYLDSHVTAVFERWYQLIQKGYFNSRPNDMSWDSGANELVYSGRAAMTLMGTWMIGYFSDASHGWVAGKDFGFFPFPLIDSTLPLVALGPIDGMVLPRGAANKMGAKEAMVFLTDIKAQKAMCTGSGALSPNIQIPPKFFSGIQQQVIQEISRSPYHAFNYDLATPPAVAEVGLNAFTEFLEFPREYKSIQHKLASDSATWFHEFRAPHK